MRTKHKTKNLNIRAAPDDLERLYWLSEMNSKSQGSVVWELIRREYDKLKEMVSLVKRQ